jgi:VWFA-related protein
MSKPALTSLVLLVSLLLPIQAQQQTFPAPRPQNTPAPQSKPSDDDQDVIRITSNLVQVDAVVTKDGKQVTDLKAEDFEVFEDGKPQNITHFSYFSNILSAPVVSSTVAKAPTATDKNAPPVAPLPAHPHDARRIIAMVIDDLGMSFESMAQVRRQARKFVDEQLQPNDLVAIIRTGGDVGALQQFTTDRQVLHNAIDHLKWNPCSRTGLHVFTPSGQGPGGQDEDSSILPCGSYTQMATMRSLRFIVEGMRDLPGRKSLVLFSEHLPIQQQEPGQVNFNGQTPSQPDDDTTGDDTLGTLDSARSYAAQLQRIAELAIRASVVIYAVDTRGLQYTGLTAADRLPPGASRNPRALQSIMNSRSRAMIANREGSDLIAKETGGFLVKNSNDFELGRIADDQKGYYLLGYRPTDQTFNRKFHHLKVTVKGHGLTVRTREGFYGVTEEEAHPPELTARDQINKALISPFGSSDITLRLTPIFVNFANTGSLLRTLIYIGARDLTFTNEPDGGHKAIFDLSTIVFGDNGRVLNQQTRKATLTLRGPDYDSALRDGVVYLFDLPLKQTGALQYRVAVRDQASGRIGTAGQFVQIPNLANERLALSGIVLQSSGAPLKQDKQTPPPSSPDNEVISSPALRQFRQGVELVFAYSIYNAQLDQATHVPQLTAQIRIFRDGKAVYTGSPVPVNTNAQPDLKRIGVGSRLQIGAEFPPGDYVLQIVVTDSLAKEKERVSTQWIDFEIVR